MKTKIVDLQEFHTSLGVLKIETRISEVNDFRSVVENKIIYNGTEFSNIKALEEKLDRAEYNLLRDEVYSLSTLLDLYIQAYHVDKTIANKQHILYNEIIKLSE